ncbi:YhfC family glutamic-type intramembrane protease [Metasolibacillus meyeri]|uniref:YhfC family glutamic-type intramembrane protease n=1 Tax=Metasolibacillus meyeri TaxID=1071052 RepID=A0AAW9NU81_9BACL|nr:YhfC family glutamic-type intramembrane protease [Metasolibacillus meyeri]MEC1177788.1 YhfC family glutamic-type intramembrane protease [Metasolibacillus meyeri]
MGKLFFIISVIILPLLFFLYALYKKNVIPFILGVVAFSCSQLLIRIPLINFIAKESSTYQFWSATKPMLILFLLALSAGIFEETARWLAMRFFLKTYTLRNGILFGLGHGGIEAVTIVGIPVVVNYFYIMQPFQLYMSGIERLCAMGIHVCLSIFVLIAVRQGKFIYCSYAILLHATVNFATGFVAMHTTPLMTEVCLVVLSTAVILITYLFWRRKKDEKVLYHTY